MAPAAFECCAPIQGRSRSMRRSNLTLSLITDEVSPSLDEALAFAHAEGIGTIDLRVIDGCNVLGLTRDELLGAAQRVRAAGLAVSCILTPLLKWSPPGKVARAKGDQFGFELGERTPGEVYAQAFEAAAVLGARKDTPKNNCYVSACRRGVIV